MNQNKPTHRSDDGDLEGLSGDEDAADASVRELVDDGQGYEADVLDGIERSADHPEEPVRTHQDPHGDDFTVDELDNRDIV